MTKSRDWYRLAAAIVVVLQVIGHSCAQETTAVPDGGNPAQPMPTLAPKPSCDDLSEDSCGSCTNPDPWCMRCGPGQVIALDRSKCLPCTASCLECYHQDDTVHPAADEVTVCTRCSAGTLLNNATDPVTCDGCGTNCLKCEINGEGKCDQGYCRERHVFVAEDMTCQSCASNCNSCSEKFKCDPTECYDGYVYSSTTELCDACGARCKKCSAAGKCDAGQCMAQSVYVEQTESCELCGDHCNDCTNSGQGKCDEGQCRDPYTTDSSNRCSPCDANCMSCQSSGPQQCDAGQCNAAFYFNPPTKTCQACAPFCKQCDGAGAGKCDSGQCMDNYGFKENTGTCEPCPVNCKKCTITNEGEKTCTLCIDRFQITGNDNSVCDFCPDNCHTCTSEGSVRRCVSNGCDSGYAYNSVDGTCHQCPSNCRTCTYRNSGTFCNTCNQYFAPRGSDGRCYACPENCDQCTDTGAGTKCAYNECRSGSTFNPADGACPSCPSNCASCFYDTEDNLKCSECELRFTLTDDRSGCAGCPENCMRCYIDGTATKCFNEGCEEGFALRTDGLMQDCQPCDSGCADCAWDNENDDPFVCKTGKCKAGYIQNSDKDCRACSNCQECQLDDRGDAECKENMCNSYYTRKTNGDCTRCPDGCTTCTYASNAATCSTGGCEANTHIQAPEDICIPCPAGCIVCEYDDSVNNGDADITCSRCGPGYELYSGTCYPCPEHCEDCSYSRSLSKTTCNNNQCEAGYEVSNGLCVACPSNCLACNLASSACTSCEDGYAGTSCEACSSNCLTCSVPGQCGTCKHGYFKTPTNLCEKCADDCDTCTSADTCDVCDKGFGLDTDENTCVECPSNCQYCTVENGETVCEWGGCKPGFIMTVSDSSRNCDECPEGCSVCKLDENNPDDTTPICVSGKCIIGYVEINGVCTECPSKCTRCYNDNGTPKCEPNACAPYYTSDILTCDCERCTDNCIKCDVNGPGDCDGNAYCDQWYFYTGGNCIFCGTGCNTCTTANLCNTDGCASGYLYNPNTQQCVILASACDVNCQSGQCTVYGQCNAGMCNDHWVLDSTTNQCVECSVGCRECNTAGTCNENACLDTYAWNAGTSSCVQGQCHTNCQTNQCDVVGTCFEDECSTNFYYNSDDQICQPCDTSCATGRCSTVGKCDKYYCTTGGWTDNAETNSDCAECSDDCVICMVDGAGKCDAENCETNFHRNYLTKQCVADSQCDAGCTDCSQQTESGKCDHATFCQAAQPNMYATVYDSSAKTCTDCTVASCALCNGVINPATHCDVCGDTKRKKNDGTLCESCPTGCSNCDSSYDATGDGTYETCDVCSEGQYMLDAMTCGVCTGTDAARCAVCSSDQTSCDICKDGNSMHGTTGCTVCGDGAACKYCKNLDQTCIVCADGRSQTSTSSTCAACAIDNCMECDLATTDAPDPKDTCEKCYPGYVLWPTDLDGIDPECHACVEYCNECDMPGTCNPNGCQDGFFYVTSSSTCQPCPRFCKDCNSATSCQSCEDGFAFSGTECKPCLPGCESCSLPGTCNTNGCETGLTYVDKICEATSCTVPNCDTCVTTNYFSCTTCGAGYYQSGGSCVKCPYGCATCTSDTNCDSCEPGRTGTVCAGLCDAVCETCDQTTSTTCATCPDGFAISVNTCAACDAKCVTCQSNDENVCTGSVCAPGYYNFPTCTQCDTLSDHADCTTCRFGSYQSDDACTVCTSPCADCTNNANTCTACISGSELIGSSCSGSTPCHPKCATCSAATDDSACTTCNPLFISSSSCGDGGCIDGYGASTATATSGQCLQCRLDHCEECTHSDPGETCTACADGYYVDTGACVPCHGTCAACIAAATSNTPTAEECTECGPGAYDTGEGTVANQKTCAYCHPSCETCSNGGTSTDCSACATGYFSKSGKCVKCTDGCDTCDINGCTACSQGYTETTGLAKCLSCGQHCMACDSVGDCLTCMPGFYLLEAAYALADKAYEIERCISCGQNCATCDTTNDCASCVTGFYFHSTDKTCEACGKHCLSCQTNEIGQCDEDQCEAGYYYRTTQMDCFGAKPVTCPTSPRENYCPTAAYCSDPANMFFEGNMCYTFDSCDNNCDRCTSQNKCDSNSCHDNYLYNPADQTCVSLSTTAACTASCRIGGCSVYGRCAEGNCNDGYGYDEDTHTCVECAANCHKCDSEGAGTCDDGECYYGFAKDVAEGARDCKRIFCPNGYHYSVSTRECVSTTNYCGVGCKACDYTSIDGSVTSTFDCLEGACETNYRWGRNAAGYGQCYQCSDNQQEVCSDESDSDTPACLFSGCEYGYTYNSNDGSCEECPTGCNKCEIVDGSVKCIERVNLNECFGTYTSADAMDCVECPSNCNSCGYNSDTNEIRCNSDGCVTGYVILENAVCYPCPNNCDACTYDVANAKSTCNLGACSYRYAQKPDTTCVVCPDFCNECSWSEAANDVVCAVNRCFDHYVQNPNNYACLACSTGCDVCDYDTSVSVTNTKCILGGCMLQFYQNEDRTCSPCPENCDECELVPGSTTTLRCLDQQCDEGYGIQDSDRNCYTCGDGCKECTIAEDSTATCVVCMPKYVLQGGNCHACPENCNSCTYDVTNSYSVCDSGSCAVRYAQNAGDPRRVCEACPTHCSACTYNTDASTTHCNDNSCATGYDVDDNSRQCGECSDNCVSCLNNGPGQCDTCVSGYVLEGTQCQRCDVNCNQCNSNLKGKCDGQSYCHGGFVYNSETQICEACDPNCSQCTSNLAGKCDNGRCNAQFILNAENTCAQCPDHCSECRYNADLSRVECLDTSCNAGYGLKTSDYTCAACPLNCNECEQRGENMVCTLCVADYILNEEECGACPQYCKSCNSQVGFLQCDTCIEGYVLLADKTCDPCPARCLTCELEGVEKVCTSCTSDDMQYDENTHCQVCSTLAFDRCTRCWDRAAGQEKAVCLECEAGYTLADDFGSCKACNEFTTDCNVCEDFAATCSLCENDLTPAPDGLFCGVECNACMGPHCDSTEHDEKIVCGHDQDLSCWMYRTELDGEIFHRRGCANYTDECTSEYSTQFCRNRGEGADAERECKQCCTGANCNTIVLNGDTSASTHVIYSVITMVTCVALAVVGGGLDDPLGIV